MERSFTYGSREVSLANQRGDPEVTYPIAEFDHTDPLFQRQIAVTGVYFYRDTTIKPLTNKLIFGDNPTARSFMWMRIACLRAGRMRFAGLCSMTTGARKTLLQLIQERITGYDAGAPTCDSASDLRGRFSS